METSWGAGILGGRVGESVESVGIQARECPGAGRECGRRRARRVRSIRPKTFILAPRPCAGRGVECDWGDGGWDGARGGRDQIASPARLRSAPT
ncbi:hypothetical protein MASR2M50_18960 [Thauera sp.]